MTDHPLSPADRSLLDAAERGDLDALRSALAAGASIEARDAEGRTALLRAAFADRVAAARLPGPVRPRRAPTSTPRTRS